MKKEKKTFILYNDYAEKFADLTDEQMGKLFKAILARQNGQEVVLDDPVIKLAWKVVAMDLKANDERYEAMCERRREAGRRGGLAKANNAREDLANISSASEDKQNLANVANASFAKHSESESDSESEIIKSDNLARGRAAARYSSLADITETEINQIAREYRTSPALVRNCLDDLRNYCDSRGKRYKNYLAALRNFVKGDLNKGAKNASQLATPSLFGKTQDDPNLARQVEILRQKPRAPATEEEIQKLRAAMPEFLQRKLAASSKKGEEKI